MLRSCWQREVEDTTPPSHTLGQMLGRQNRQYKLKGVKIEKWIVITGFPFIYYLIDVGPKRVESHFSLFCIYRAFQKALPILKVTTLLNNK